MRNNHARVSEPHTFKSCVGDRIHKLYESRFDGSRVVLEEAGSFDIQERINGYAPYTDISYMLNRLTVGDDSVLNKRTPMYGDFSGMPDNPADAINLYHNAETAFSQLSTEDKLRYNNDFRVWLASIMGSSATVSDSVVDIKLDNEVNNDNNENIDIKE